MNSKLIKKKTALKQLEICSISYENIIYVHVSFFSQNGILFQNFHPCINSNTYLLLAQEPVFLLRRLRRRLSAVDCLLESSKCDFLTCLELFCEEFFLVSLVTETTSEEDVFELALFLGIANEASGSATGTGSEAVVLAKFLPAPVLLSVVLRDDFCRGGDICLEPLPLFFFGGTSSGLSDLSFSVDVFISSTELLLDRDLDRDLPLIG